MKKTLLASLLALAFVGSANAAVVPVTTSIVLPTSGTVALGGPTLGGTIATQYWEVVGNAAGHVPVKITYLNSLIPADQPIVWNIYADTNSGLGVANTGALLATGTIGVAPLAPSATYLFLASTQYVLEFQTTATATVARLDTVPVPAAAWLFGSALFGAGALRRKQKAA